MMFSKRSTRTRVSTESAVALMGGHPMFLGKDDIQLGVCYPLARLWLGYITSLGPTKRVETDASVQVNESLRDTSIIISSMTACMVARVGAHSEITGLAAHSSVPVINALSSDFHPLQTIADFQTIREAFADKALPSASSLGLEGLRVAWVGDCNNVLFDLATGCVKMGVDIAVASPQGYGIPNKMREWILAAGADVASPGKLSETTIPEEAVKGADVIVTDTWVSMGQEAESQKRLKAFAGYQVTNELAKRGGAKPNWKFMHCLPRHQEEVDDNVFYGPRSLVFPEGENRLWAAVCKFPTSMPQSVVSIVTQLTIRHSAAALEAFVVNKGKVL